MKNYKITIQYDGTRYKGWQVLTSSDMTIQGKLQNILSRLAGEQIDVIGSGRTDAGVHAKGQVANFHISDRYSTNQIMEAFTKYLPDDISVTDIEEVPDRFHARFNATSKTYTYYINTAPKADVFNQRFQYHYGKTLDIHAMKAALESMLGTHDFTSFCGNSHFKKSAVRTVSDISLTANDSIIAISYSGDGFLQNMVRIMTGTLIEVGNGSRDANSIAALIELKDRSAAGYTAPPQGLFLEKVMY